MARMRVHELAKLLGVESARVLTILAGLGSDATNHMAVIGEQEASAVRAALTREALLKQREAMQARRPGSGQAAQPQAKTIQRARSIAPAPTPVPVQKARVVQPDTTQPAARRAEPEAAVEHPAPAVESHAAPAAAVEAEPTPAAVRATEPGLTVVRETEVASSSPATPEATPAAAVAAGATGAAPSAGSAAPRAAAPRDRAPERPRGPATGTGSSRPAGGARPAGRPAARPPAARPAEAAGGGESTDQAAADSRARPRQRPAGAGATGAAARRRPGSTGPGGARPGARPRTAGSTSRPTTHRGRGPSQALEARRPVRKTKIVIEGPMTVKELAAEIGAPMAEAVKTLIGMGIMANVNQTIDVAIARRLAAEMGAQVEAADGQAADESGKVDVKEKSSKFLLERPPVITVMGHVDHGKTTLLDTIRRSNVVAQEAGGITQHIGASVVNHNGRNLVFIDTPGHEAFTAMRARGAKVTDVVILVVAADDGVKPQTIEAVNHIRAAKVPMIVAVNKIDRPGADPDRVKRQLSEHGVVAEEWGGDTVFVEVSALKGQGVDALLEMIVLIADMQELRANPLRPAKGTVIEAKLDRSRGPVATVLVQTGTLRVGDTVVAGGSFGRVRALYDPRGERVDQAGPSQPVEILGLADVPEAGEQFDAVEDEHIAREMATKYLAERKTEQSAGAMLSLETLYQNIKAGNVKDLNVIVKVDVQGSLEALEGALAGLTLTEVRLNMLHGGVGPITETDVMLAKTSNAIIIGFNVRPDTNARRIAQQEQVDVRTYEIIYQVLDDISAAAKGMLAPKMQKVQIGKAQVRATFSVPKVGLIAGCYVQEGRITRNSEVKVIRDGVVLHEGKLSSLKRFKDDVREVQTGFECGIGVDNFEAFSEGDIIEAYVVEKVERTG